MKLTKNQITKAWRGYVSTLSAEKLKNGYTVSVANSSLDADYDELLVDRVDSSLLDYYIRIKNIMKMKVKKLVYGVGINDADYAVTKYETTIVNGKRERKLVWICPYYKTWKNMLNRCYSSTYQNKKPTYRGCSVSEDWLTFSVFKNWMETQDWQDKQLDKDLLFRGNKVYSAGTCVFVSGMVNMFTIDSGASRGEWLIGVNWNKGANKFMSRCCNPFTQKQEHLGYFTCEQEAHQAWLTRKLELAKELAAEQTNPRVAEALVERYTIY